MNDRLPVYTLRQCTELWRARCFSYEAVMKERMIAGGGKISLHTNPVLYARMVGGTQLKLSPPDVNHKNYNKIAVVLSIYLFFLELSLCYYLLQ